MSEKTESREINENFVKINSDSDALKAGKPQIDESTVESAGEGPASPKISTTSPKVSAASPKVSAVSPKVSAASPKVSAASPKVSAASPKASAASPKTSAASPKTSAVSPKAENAAALPSSPKVGNEDKTIAPKRTPKRMSFIERAQKESEELVKTLGGSLELEGGRRTRSSTRGTSSQSTVFTTPPPTKKSRTSSPKASPSSRRGRGRKLDISAKEPVQALVKSDEVEKVDNVNEEHNVNEVNATEKSANATKEIEEKVEKPVVVSDLDGTVSQSPNESEKTANVAEKLESPTNSSLEPEPEKVQETEKGDEHNNSSSTVQHVQDTKPVPSEPETVDAFVAEVEKKECPQTESGSITINNANEIEKQPTPEPMEVDATSFNDNVDGLSSPKDAEDLPDSSSPPPVVQIDKNSCEVQTIDETPSENQQPDATDERAPDTCSTQNTDTSDHVAIGTLETSEPLGTQCDTAVVIKDDTKSAGDSCATEIVMATETSERTVAPCN